MEGPSVYDSRCFLRVALQREGRYVPHELPNSFMDEVRREEKVAVMRSSIIFYHLPPQWARDEKIRDAMRASPLSRYLPKYEVNSNMFYIIYLDWSAYSLNILNSATSGGLAMACGRLEYETDVFTRDLNAHRAEETQ